MAVIDEKVVIAVLMGGPGSEREVSLASGKAVVEALAGEGLTAVGVDVTDRAPVLPDGTDLAMNVIHGTFGEDGELQSYLEGLGVPYTGAGVKSSRLAFDKVASKECFLQAGVPTPVSERVDCSGELRMPEMDLPYVVKPPREGSSVGVHIVREEAEARAAMADASKYGDEVLVEQFIDGKELTVGIVGDEIFPVIEIIPPEDGWYDMATKYPWMSGGSGTGSQYVCPAELAPGETAAIQAAAWQAHQCLGIEVYSRVDVLLDSFGNPYILEANTIPGMTASSLLPKAAAAATPAYSFGALCRLIAELSWELRRGSHVEA
ncbi:MAG: D-alanine--D-alanine ligase [Akkermansiaceae bacterium]|nr:D-alanine--D-alanine ligase [Akkermansiaceae bacterium]